MEPLERVKLRLDVVALVLTLIGGVVGAGFTVYEFYKGRELERTKESMEMVSRISSDSPVQKSMEKLNLVVGPMASSLFEQMKSRSDPGSLESSLLKLIDEQKLMNDIDIVTAYAEEAAICGCQNVCDLDLVQRFLGESLGAVFSVVGPYVMRVRTTTGRSRFGLALEAFAKENVRGYYCNR